MSKQVTRRIANAFIWLGLALIAFGCAMAYPFVRDAIEAQSAPASLSFVVTPEPVPVEATLTAPADAPASAPLATTAVVSLTDTPTPEPLATTAATTLTVTPVPSPAFLPDNTTVSLIRATTQAMAQATPQPALTASGEPPDRLAIPAIQLDAPVVTVGWHVEQIGGAAISVWDVPNWRAAGWLKTSASIGQKGNTVLDGHHNIAGEVFRRLIDLKPGDKIEVFVGKQVFTYGITEKHLLPDRDQPMPVRIANAKYIQPTEDERLTLVTCWPYTNNTHRLVIVARPLNQNKGRGME